MRRHTALRLSLVSCALVLSAESALAQAARRPTRPPPQPPRTERQLVCRGASMPVGWVLVDDLRESSMCGGDNPATLNAYNVWAIERYDNRPVGTMLLMCASMPTPPGWIVVDVYREKNACGHPDEAFAVNVKRIQRAR